MVVIFWICSCVENDDWMSSTIANSERSDDKYEQDDDDDREEHANEDDIEGEPGEGYHPEECGGPRDRITAP